MLIEIMYEKFPWIRNYPMFVLNGHISLLAFRSYEEIIKKAFLLNIFETISDFFGGTTYFIGSNQDQEKLSHLLTIWISGLGGLTIAQILRGLLDIIEGQTDYIKFPPKSVLEFHSVCRTPRPDRYSAPQTYMPIKALEFDNSQSDEKTCAIRKVTYLILIDSLKDKGAGVSKHFCKFFMKGEDSEQFTYDDLNDYEKSIYRIEKKKSEMYCTQLMNGKRL